MIQNDSEKLIDEIANRIKAGRDVSVWQNHREYSPLVHLMSKLSLMPKSKLPKADFARIKNQVLDRISVPADIKVAERAGIWLGLPQLLKIVGTIGSLLILVSLGAGTAIAALQSVPGQPTYALKKTVENIELAFTRDPQAKANLQIQFANNRLDELATVIEKSRSGEISSDDAQKIVTQTVSDLQKTTAAIADNTSSSDNSKPKVSTLTKLVDLSNKQVAVLQPLLSAASISNEGEVKIVLQKAIETSITSKEQAVKNIENAGLKLEDQPISINDNNQINAKGKITSITDNTVSIGTSKFLVTNDTEYVNIKATDLKVDTLVEISGEVKDDNKTYALTITGSTAANTQAPDTNTSNTTTQNSTDTQSNPSTTDASASK